MVIDNLLYDYLHYCRENDKTDRTIVEYQLTIKSFNSCLQELFNSSNENYEKILQKLNRDDLISIFRLMVKKRNIRFDTTLQKQYRTVTTYYKYLYEKHQMYNEVFINNNYLDKLTDSIANLSTELLLNKKETKLPITELEFRKLLLKCDDAIDVYTVEELLDHYHIKNGVYTRFVSAIIIKLVLLSGITVQTVDELDINNFNLSKNKMIIKNYELYLPISISNQLRKYLRLREIIFPNYMNKKLFTQNKNINKKQGNVEKSKILFDTVQHCEIASIAKYSIIEMIRQGISSYCITEFTGYSIDVYNHCYEEYLNSCDNEYISKETDCKIRQCSYFELL